MRGIREQGPGISRRGLLRMLGVALPAAVVAPKYFFAPVGGWKSDVIVHPLRGGLPFCADDGSVGVGSLDPSLWGLFYWQVAQPLDYYQRVSRL